MENYNGWTNFATWSVAVLIDNDEHLYRICRGRPARRIRDIIQELAAHLRGMEVFNWNDVNWDEIEQHCERE